MERYVIPKGVLELNINDLLQWYGEGRVDGLIIHVMLNDGTYTMSHAGVTYIEALGLLMSGIQTIEDAAREREYK